ncbi:hypothetical protein ACQKCH_12235 [Nubsella zeaxanthinifaciens]|uniref:hypothetical protein n=1 Tax=Nubsella zeaxanthinifaciens TaxID=392412 RepID=UPI003D083FDC
MTTKHLLYLSTVALFISCGRNNNPQQVQPKGNSDSVAALNDPKNHLNIQMKEFSEVDSSGVLMFPLAMGETDTEDSGLSYKRIPNNTYWNIIFYNSATKAYHLLTERKILIGSYSQNYGSDGKNIWTDKKPIFYMVRTDDFNKDNKLTEEDPQYLFISDGFGNNFKQISPTNYNVNNWEFVKRTNKVIMTVSKDSDGNATFDETDEITTFEFTLDKDSVPQEIFPENFKNKLKILFDKDWKRVKN